MERANEKSDLNVWSITWELTWYYNMIQYGIIRHSCISNINIKCLPNMSLHDFCCVSAMFQPDPSWSQQVVECLLSAGAIKDETDELLALHLNLNEMKSKIMLFKAIYCSLILFTYLVHVKSYKASHVHHSYCYYGGSMKFQLHATWSFPRHGRTALIRASAGHLEVVRLLCEAGSNKAAWLGQWPWPDITAAATDFFPKNGGSNISENAENDVHLENAAFRETQHYRT